MKKIYKLETIKKRNRKNLEEFHNFVAGLFGIVIDNSTNYESDSEYVALMRRRNRKNLEKFWK